MGDKKVLIAGAGPSAAYAVMACRARGIKPMVVTKVPPSTQVDGAFFLHWLPAELKFERYGEAHEILISGVGSAENYTKKQWGAPVPSSFPEQPRTELWYDSRALLRVWDRQDWVSGDLGVVELKGLATQYDAVLHTYTVAPQHVGRHCKWFPVRTFHNDGDSNRPLEILYNGNLSDRWVRMTQSFTGRVTFEFPDEAATEMDLEFNSVWRTMEQNKLRDLPPDTKPVERSEWLAPNVAPIGRFARWDRKLLSHHAYDHTLELLEEVGC